MPETSQHGLSAYFQLPDQNLTESRPHYSVGLKRNYSIWAPSFNFSKKYFVEMAKNKLFMSYPPSPLQKGTLWMTLSNWMKAEHYKLAHIITLLSVGFNCFKLTHILQVCKNTQFSHMTDQSSHNAAHCHVIGCGMHLWPPQPGSVLDSGWNNQSIN